MKLKLLRKELLNQFMWNLCKLNSALKSVIATEL